VVNRIAPGLALALVLAVASASTSASPRENTQQAVRSALERGGYPWYDAPNDAARPITPIELPDAPPKTREGWSGFQFGAGDLGQLIVFVFMAVGLIALFVYLARTWQRYLERLEGTRNPRHPPGSASRVASLPAGLGVETDDPWNEARRRRDGGDLTGAIICLFVHILIILDRRGKLRLAPGRTGRQLVRSIGAEEIRRRVEPTLRLFEAAYYGHRAPTPEAFAEAWAQAELVERLVAREAP
jgi:hypothetical protein